MPGKTRIALYLLIVSVAVSAILGILALLSGNWGWFELRILLTTLTISVGSICALACAALWERKNEQTLPLFGLIFTVISVGLVIFLMWKEPESPVLWRTTIITTVLAIGTSHFSLLSLANLSRQFTWARIFAATVIYGLAAHIIWLTVGKENDWLFRSMGVFSVLTASVSVLIPIFHKLSAADFANALTRPLARVICPGCDAEQTHALGEIICQQCRSIFSVNLIRQNQPSREQ